MIDFNFIADDIQSQYKNTNIEELIKGIVEIKNKYLFNAYKSLVNDNISLSTAKGVGLDLWGFLIDLNRYIPTDKSEEYNYFNFNSKNFNKLIFLNKNKPGYSSLKDSEFREMLLLKFQGYFIFPSVPYVNEFVNSVFKKYGNVVVRDTNDMSYQIYTFNSKIPSWLFYVLSIYDILPRPAGIYFKIIQKELMLFGFGPDKKRERFEYNFFNFSTNFKNTLFYESKRYYKNLAYPANLNTNIQELDYQRKYKWTLENIGNLNNSIFNNHQHKITKITKEE